jgi:hypothetical protein
MATFACRVEGAGVLQEAQLSVFRPADPGGLLSSSQEPIS